MDMESNSNISSGIRSLDALTDGFLIGDNVVWQVESGTSIDAFLYQFIKQSIADRQNIIYVCFNRSPLSILKKLGILMSGVPENLILLDCFTSGKGKDDRTFREFYDKNSSGSVIRMEKPGDIDSFINLLNSIEDQQPSGTRYIFDSLTGIQDLWGDEERTHKFFTYMCPRLYDLNTVAYWILEKDAHSQKFKANISHVTQVVLDLYKKKDQLYVKALKLEGRGNREAYKSHLYRVIDNDIEVIPVRKEVKLDIGTRLKEARGNLGISQKELADKVGVSPSFISQLESNQISPSLNSFMLICSALSINPADIWEKLMPKKQLWLKRREDVLSNVILKGNGLLCSSLFMEEGFLSEVCILEPGAALDLGNGGETEKQMVYLINGNVTVVVDETSEDIKEGDTLFLNRDQSSIWRNNGKERAQLLFVRV
jgi:transcriptional regulator with XRE-family HTH domain